MIFLEQITNQILREEGQIIISLSDLGITWEDIESLFIGTFEQAKAYITTYDWETKVIGNTPQTYDISHVKHITYNTAYNMQRVMPDIPGNYWEFNPYTKKISSLMNTNFALEVAKYATLTNLPYTLHLSKVKKGKYKNISLPCIPSELKISISNSFDELSVDIDEVNYNYNSKNEYLDNSKECICDNSSTNELEFSGDATGTFNPNTLRGQIKFDKDYDGLDLTFTSKYVGLLELSMTCELFYKWYKGNLLTMIGSIKNQINMSSSDMPFDFTQDNLLERGRQILQEVEELKGTKSHWSNF